MKKLSVKTHKDYNISLVTPLPSKTRDSGKEVEGWEERLEKQWLDGGFLNSIAPSSFKKLIKFVENLLSHSLAQAREEGAREKEKEILARLKKYHLAGYKDLLASAGEKV